MKIITSILLASFSLTAFAGVCDLQSYNDEIERVNVQFDNFEIRAEDQHIAITLIERLKGKKVLDCVIDGTTGTVTKRDFILASDALQSEVYDEVHTLDKMIEYYEISGNYLMVDKINEEKTRVYLRQKEINAKIAKLSELAPF